MSETKPFGLPAITSRAQKYSASHGPLKAIQRCMDEINGGTYFRTPSEMLETPQWLKLQYAERIAREARQFVEPVSVMVAENERLQKENDIRQGRIDRLEKLHRDIIAYQAGKAEQ